MAYLGTLFVAIIAFVLGYVMGNIHGRKAIIKRIAEDVMDMFDIKEEQKDE